MKTLRIVVVLNAALMLSACAPTRAPFQTAGPNLSPYPSQPAQSRTQDRYADLAAKSMAVVEEYAENVGGYLRRQSKAAAIVSAKKNVADSMKDPSSAQFRNVRLVPYGNGSVICGEVNAKNSYGGYVGFKNFVASTSSATLAYDNAKYPEIGAAANAGLTTACK